MLLAAREVVHNGGVVGVDSRSVVAVAAVAAVVARFPGLAWPLRPDEAGFALVATAWDPTAGGELYGPYWVDRAPVLLATVRLLLELGGPAAPRLAAAAGCAVAVLAAALAGRSLARQVLAHVATRRPLPEVGTDRVVGRAGAWSAVAAAAFTGHAAVDPISAKGEVLALPLLLLAAWWALVGVERRSPVLAFAAGAAGVLALGMKQSMVGALALAGLLLLGALVGGRPDRRTTVGLAVAWLAGAAAPVLAVVAWGAATGVRVAALWEVLVGFRADALSALAGSSLGAPLERASLLALVAVANGMLLLGVLLLRRSPALLRLAPVPAVAVLGTVVVEVVALVLGGSFWTSYLLGLVPGLTLATALLVTRHELARPVPDPRAARAARPPRRGPARARLRRLGAAQVAVGFAAASTVVSLAWFAAVVLPGRVHADARLGEAIARSALPGDTLVVYGGRPDIVWASGLSSPYRYLWNLPMRTRDPRLEELERVLADEDRRPTWVVVDVPLAAWEGFGRDLAPLLRSYYAEHGRSCSDRPVLVRADVVRPEVEPDCD